MEVTIIVAIITGVFSVLVALIQKTRRENKEDHNVVYNSIRHLHDDLKKVDDKLDNHIDWHLKKK